MFKQPITMGMAFSVFLSGISFAATIPYGAIIGIEILGIQNEIYALLLTISSIVSACVALGMGYFSDVIKDRRLMVITSALAGALGFGLIYFVRTKLVFFISFAIIMPFGFALFSQCFSFARTYYNLRHPQNAEFMVSVLRTIFAAAFVLIPPIAAWVADKGQVFDVYGIAATAYILAAIVFALLLRNDDAKIGTENVQVPSPLKKAPTRRAGLYTILGITSITVIQIALSVHMIAIPLAIVSDFNGTLADVGIAASLVALIEIPFMLLWGFTASRIPKYIIIGVSAAVYAIYLVLIGQAGSVQEILWLQILNGISSAALLSITISYMQETIAGRVGLSTSLMDVVRVLANIVSAAIFAYASIRFGYLALFPIAGVFALAGTVLLFISHIPKHRRIAV